MRTMSPMGEPTRNSSGVDDTCTTEGQHTGQRRRMRYEWIQRLEMRCEPGMVAVERVGMWEGDDLKDEKVELSHMT